MFTGRSTGIETHVAFREYGLERQPNQHRRQQHLPARPHRVAALIVYFGRA